MPGALGLHMAARTTFGTPDKRDNDGAEAVLSRMELPLAEALCQVGLHDISCVDPRSGFVAALVDECGVKSVEDFLYVDAEFHEEASKADCRGSRWCDLSQHAQ